MYSYTAFGLQIASEFTLPELAPGHGPHQITIRRAHLESALPPGDHASWVDDTGAVFMYWADLGVFRVRLGLEIDIDLRATATPDRMRLFLLGAAVGVLLQQRGYHVLHASAVASQSGAVAFLGPKGMGKSTIAAALQARGYQVVTDDVLAVNTDGFPFRVSTGHRQLKLWPDALGALGYDAGRFARLHPLFEKREFCTEQLDTRTWPLAAIYVLAYGDTVRVNALSRSDALFHVLTNWYGFRFERPVHLALGQAAALGQTAALLKRIPVFVLERPIALHCLPEVADVIERHIRTYAGTCLPDHDRNG